MQKPVIAPTKRLSLSKVAARLGLGRRLISALINRNELSPPMKLGAKVPVWRASAIGAFIAQRIGDQAVNPLGEQGGTKSPPEATDTSAERRSRSALELNQLNLGFLGKFFGSGSSASTNIAGSVALGSLALIAASFLFAPTPEIVDARNWLFALITSALGFIFGAASKK